MILCPYSSISAISGQWEVDNGRICATEPNFCMKRFLPQVGFELGIAKPGLIILNEYHYLSLIRFDKHETKVSLLINAIKDKNVPQVIPA